MNTMRLSNDVLMPQIMMGTSICDLNGDVSVTLRTASRFAKALQMDFIPVLTPEAEPVSTTVIPKTVVGRMKTI